MTLRWMDGFDDIAATADSAFIGLTTTSVSYLSSSGRFSGRCLDLTAGNNGFLTLPLTALINADVMIGGFAIRFSEQPAQTNAFFGVNRGTAVGSVSSGANSCFSLKTTNGSNNIQAFNAAGSAVGSAFAFSPAVWHWIDFSITALSSTSGILTLKLDGTTVISALTGNFAGASATGTTWNISWQNRVTDTLIDDIVVCDDAGSVNNSIIGDHRIVTKRPNGTSSAGGFTGTGGTLSAALAEAGSNDGDTSYAGTSTLADDYLVTLAALGITATSIAAVKNRLVARKVGTDASSVTPKIKSSSTTASGAAVAMTTSYSYAEQIQELDPNGNIAWITTSVDAAVIGAGVT